jgi:hypothetical protein
MEDEQNNNIAIDIWEWCEAVGTEESPARLQKLFLNGYTIAK